MFRIMSLAHKLRISEEEILEWSPARFYRWLAYFKITAEEEKKVLDRAKREAGHRK